MMQCRDIDELMVEFLYQELEGERLADFQKHVEGCAHCGAEMKSLMRTRQALRALPEAEPSPAVSARLLHEAAKRTAPAPERAGSRRRTGSARSCRATS
jgi:anti-sigma factor RsiW